MILCDHYKVVQGGPLEKWDSYMRHSTYTEWFQLTSPQRQKADGTQVAFGCLTVPSSRIHPLILFVNCWTQEIQKSLASEEKPLTCTAHVSLWLDPQPWHHTLSSKSSCNHSVLFYILDHPGSSYSLPTDHHLLSKSLSPRLSELSQHSCLHFYFVIWSQLNAEYNFWTKQVALNNILRK